MIIFYRLIGHDPEPEPDALVWGLWMSTADRVVARTAVAEGVEVSTVFLGLDHNFAADGPPILFETMIFGGEHADLQRRYPTWAEAEQGHAEIVRLLRATRAAPGDPPAEPERPVSGLKPPVRADS